MSFIVQNKFQMFSSSHVVATMTILFQHMHAVKNNNNNNKTSKKRLMMRRCPMGRNQIVIIP